jgi:hypothetical protein
MDKLLPGELIGFWQTVVQHEHTTVEYTEAYDRLLAEYRQTWEGALISDGHQDLSASLLAELGRYTQGEDNAEVRHRCVQAVTSLKREWDETVRPADRRSIERFYDKS